MCERARRVANLAGVPRTEWGGIESFFERLQQVAPELPVVAGELMLEFHRGVFTTHSRLKAAFRGSERALQLWEAAHVASGRGPIPGEAWRRLLFAQFHDYIPGSSIWEVYAEAIPELERLAENAADKAAEALAGEGEAAWFNPSPFARTWVAGERCFLLPPLSGDVESALRVLSVAPPAVGPDFIANERINAKFDTHGGLTRLVIDGQTIALTGEGHQIRVYADHPAWKPAWQLDRTSLTNGVAAIPVGKPRVERDGLTATVVFSSRIGASASTVDVRYSVVAGEPVLRLEYVIDWRDPETLLKAVFSTGYLGCEARFGAPFGSILRNQWPGYPREEAQWEVPASRWLVLADDAQSEGLAVLTEAKYGFTVRDGVVGVSLLRSAFVTEADDHRAIREAPNRPRHSDLGVHYVKLALGRYSATLPAESQPALLADRLFTPCISYRGGAVTSGLRGVDEAPSLVPAWAEPLVGRAWRLRLHETLGRNGSARVLLAPGWKAKPVGLDGKAAAVWVQEALSVPFGPYKVLTVEFKPTEP
jgi:alpha-mannosidase